MKKKTFKAFDKKVYLLGKDKEGTYYYLEEPSWDCGWYWGFGYVETYTNNKRPDLSRDIKSHSHFNTMFLKNHLGGVIGDFKDLLVETPLNDSEIWTLLDCMKTFYTLSKSAEVFGRGYSFFTEKAKIDGLKRKDLEKLINKDLLPLLFEKIDKILTD